MTAQVYALDTDHDGLIDEGDLPYDQLLLLERARAAQAAEQQAAPEAPAPSEPSPPRAVKTAARAPDRAAPAGERDAPRVDLRA